MTERPLSPHLSVYRMYRYTLLTSILLTRATGVALSVGLILLVYWLVAVASGPAAYHDARAVLSLGVLKAIYLVLLAAFSCHLLAGIRHLNMDMHMGLDLHSARATSMVVLALSVVLTIVAGALLW